MTVGETIKKLVDKHGQSTIGIYILERALVQSLNAHTVLVDNCPIADNPRYQEIETTEQHLLAELKLQMNELKIELAELKND